MSTMLQLVRARAHVAHVHDERDTGSGIIVTLQGGFCFFVAPGCGVHGFDSVAEAERGTRSAQVYRE